MKIFNKDISELTIGIIGGKGKMGALFAKFLKPQCKKILISDLNTEIGNKELVGKSDIIIISVPILATKSIIKDITNHTHSKQILMDLTSLKVFPTEEMKKGKAEVIGLHPMFGPSVSKLQTIVMCPVRTKHSKEIEFLFKKIGAQIKISTPKNHDKMMAHIQVMLHFHTILMGNMIRKSKVDIKEITPYMSPVYRLEFNIISRIFSQEANLYGPILTLNPFSKKIMKNFQELTKNLAKTINEKNLAEFNREFLKTRKFLGENSLKAAAESSKIIDYLYSL